MKTDGPINLQAIWKRVAAEFALPVTSEHGPEHWKRVEQNGLKLAARTGARIEVVRLFAVFHDSRRRHEYTDPEHGWRGAEFARKLRGELYEMDNEGFRLLFVACTIHTDDLQVRNPTIGTCLDADRLDLGRVGIMPDPKYMSTQPGAKLARQLRRRKK